MRLSSLLSARLTERAIALAVAASDRASETIMLGRLARDLPRFLRQPMTLEGARAGIRRRLADRPGHLLDLLDRTVFPYPESPYGWLLSVAGCEPGDVRRLVEQEGLEGALAELAARGVYLTFDEQKGRRTVVRGSQRRLLRDRELDNPSIAPHLVVYTGGSRGRPSRVLRALAGYQELAAFLGVALAAHGVDRSRHVLWLNGPIDWLMMQAKLGRTIEAWYHPLSPLAWQVQGGARLLGRLGRLAGTTFPLPEPGDVADPARMARMLAERQGGAPSLAVNAMVSAATRVALEADRLGFDLSGITFVLEGEPLTPVRARIIEAVGARAIANYASMELNTLGYSCAAGVASDDVHFASFRSAVVEREREAIAGGPRVRALTFTSLSSYDSKIVLNAELGDMAIVEERDCGCQLGALGLRTHLSQIRSFEKLTGEGVTLVNTDLADFLEHRVPRRFGGSGLDYQLVEEEARDGLTRLVLRVSPAVGAVDEQALCAMVLAHLRERDVVTQYHARLLEHLGTLSVRRAPPLATRAGKVLPFALAPEKGG